MQGHETFVHTQRGAEGEERGVEGSEERRRGSAGGGSALQGIDEKFLKPC